MNLASAFPRCPKGSHWLSFKSYRFASHVFTLPFEITFFGYHLKLPFEITYLSYVLQWPFRCTCWAYLSELCFEVTFWNYILNYTPPEHVTARSTPLDITFCKWPFESHVHKLHCLCRCYVTFFELHIVTCLSFKLPVFEWSFFNDILKT